MRRATNTVWGTRVIFSIVAALLAPSAAAAPISEPGTYPISELPMLAQQYAPGVAVPTKLPTAITQFRLGPGKLIGYAQRASYEIEFERNASSLLGFKLDVFSGMRVAPVARAVRIYLRKGGWAVTTSPFTAGPYHGLVEFQRNGGIRFAMYSWASGGATYVMTVYVLYVGKPQNPWSKKSVIASFAVP